MKKKKKGTIEESSLVDGFLKANKSGQTVGSCVMHSYWFVLNYYLAKDGIASHVDFDDLCRLFLQWIDSHKMNIDSQQDGIRVYILTHQKDDNFKCEPFLHSMYPFVYNNEAIPSINNIPSLDSRDLELYTTSVFHYYCKDYMLQNAAVFDSYKIAYPTLYDEKGIRGYLLFYEFDKYLAKEGHHLLFPQRPSNFAFSIPRIEYVERGHIKDFLSSIGDSMVLFNGHSRVVFDYHNNKWFYDSNKKYGPTHIKDFNAYLHNHVSFLTTDKSKKERIEFMQIQPIEQRGDSSKVLENDCLIVSQS